MKIVVFGCQQIAVDFLKYVESNGDVEIPLVVTYNLPLDKVYGYKCVLEYCKHSGLNVVNPNKVTDAIVDEISRIQPDIIFSVYYRKILPEKVLNIPRLGCINIHPSMLPKYRGPVPTAWAIMNGENTFGITIHYMDNKIDTGDILIQKEYDIQEKETGFELYTRAMKLGAELLMKNFNKILNQELKPRKQKGCGSYYGKKEGIFLIDWRNKVETICNIIRIHSKPYNPAQSVFFNKYLFINKASLIFDDQYILQGPGVIVGIIDNDKIVVSCVDGCLLLEEYEIIPKLNEIENEVYMKIGNRLG